MGYVKKKKSTKPCGKEILILSGISHYGLLKNMSQLGTREVHFAGAIIACLWGKQGQWSDMKKKKFDLESKIEKLEDILEERLESIEDRLKEDLERVEKEIEKLKPNNKTKAHD